MRLKFLLTCLLGLCVIISGCNWVGSTAGKAKAKVERKFDSMEQGYEEGYTEEKERTKKSAPATKKEQ